ncbi:hypothetical protein F2P56_036226 [Juglans regia]|uniref:Uncharacterized protein LOC109006491 n=2 Tax=Juglans regia TaxID=51240 RepID=A0A2I4GBP9_JUGRE|nr:uncharacterized protein LOC109006491 [Juglans regia]KAF5443690.1 hypothetical protein F2P56_036226 [Juglans regia]
MERIQELEWMKLCMRKLALWLTRTFNPIMTHDDLEPLMATLGFVALPPSPPHPASTPWKEYHFTAGGSFWTSSDSADSPPKPRLPFPRIDGLHVNTYRAFLDAVNFYVNMPNISDLFHVRGMPLNTTDDRSRKWRRMSDDESVFVYREGTLEQGTTTTHNSDKNSKSSDSNKTNGNCNSVIRSKGNGNTPVICLVSLKDVIQIL